MGELVMESIGIQVVLHVEILNPNFPAFVQAIGGYSNTTSYVGTPKTF